MVKSIDAPANQFFSGERTTGEETSELKSVLHAVTETTEKEHRNEE
jgi:hypothetical protein